MPVIDRMIDQASIHLPAMIREVSYSDPILHLWGESWSLVVTTAWRVVGPEGLAFGAGSSDATDRAWDLIGSAIDTIAPQSTWSPVDPAFVLSSGLTLEVFSVDKIEPWVLRIADQVWVAAPDDFSAFD